MEGFLQRNDKIGLYARKIILTTGLKIGWGRYSANKRWKHGDQLGDCWNIQIKDDGGLD